MTCRLFAAVLAAGLCLIAPDDAASQASPLQQSHIEAHVPAPADFDAFLERDLGTYFAEYGLTNPRVRFSLLRDGPTQSGVSWPKYYAWVVVASDGSAPVEGAVRLAAIDRVRFNVTDFLTREDLSADPDLAGSVFPAVLVPLIQQRAAGY
jgi:hypothetical protein